MKKLVTACVFLTMIVTSFAQVTEGKVVYAMDMTATDPQMSAAVAMMQGSTMEVYFAPGKSRSDVKMGVTMSIVTIIDEQALNGLMLLDVWGEKVASEIPVDSLSEYQSDSLTKYIETAETKEILGFKCTKAILVTEHGDLIMWFTRAVTAKMDGHAYILNDMPGFPLEYQIISKGIKMSFTAKSFEKGVEAAAFSLTIPEGYEVEPMNNIAAPGQ